MDITDIEITEKEIKEKEEFMNFKDESYKNKDYFPEIYDQSKEEKKDILRENLDDLIKTIAASLKNEYYIIINKDVEIYVEGLKIKYNYIRNVAIINDLYGLTKFENILTEFDLGNLVDKIEITNGVLSLVEFNIKKQKLAQLDGYYKVYKMNDTLVLLHYH